MEILSDIKIKSLFCSLLLLMAAFALLFAVFWGFLPESAAACMFISFLLFGLFVLARLHHYFKEQNRVLEEAAGQVEEYVAGNHDVRLACDEEGALCKLFHEVNALAAILNAHAENEENAKKFLKESLSDISHQLKTPLSALHVYIGILQEEGKDSQTVSEFSALSEQELERIETLVQMLLKIARLDAGAAVLDKAEENVADMMGEIEKHFSYRAEQEGKELIFSGSDEVSLLCDRGWMSEAVSNIVKNAFDHTEKGDVIRIEWERFASVVQIRIADNGCGIHPEDLYHIFKRFYRSRFSKDSQGAGLGLPLSKSIIEAHNGTVEVDSELGSGSVFTIHFRG